MINYNNPKSYMTSEEYSQAQTIVNEINRVTKGLIQDHCTIEQIKEYPYIKELNKKLDTLKSTVYASAKIANNEY